VTHNIFSAPPVVHKQLLCLARLATITDSSFHSGFSVPSLRKGVVVGGLEIVSLSCLVVTSYSLPIVTIVERYLSQFRIAATSHGQTELV